MVDGIVSLLPSATEIVYALGLGDRLVGVTHECDYPPEARSKPVLTASALPAAARSADIDRHVRASLHAGSSLYTLDAALLERLAPALIVTQELCEVCAVSYDIVARAAKRLVSDPRIVSLEPASLEDVFANIATVAELAGVPERAAGVVEPLRERVRTLRAKTAGAHRPRTLVLEWTDPPMSAGHWIPELVEIAGGEPVLADPGGNSRVLSWEAIAAADPDVIIVSPCGFDLAKTREAIGELATIGAWASLRAVRAGRVAAIDGNAFVSRPGPRLVESAELFADAIAGKELPV
jgi:iron complex transport system substrate-binding protein